MANKTCKEWRDKEVLADGQRAAAVREVVGSRLEVAFVIDDNDTYDTIGFLATADSDPASIADAMNLVLTVEDVDGGRL